MNAQAQQVHFYSDELVPRNQGAQGIGALQLALVLIAIVVMVVTAGPEPTDLVTLAVLVLLEAGLNGIKNSRNSFPEATVEKLAQLSDSQIAELVPHRYLSLALRQVREWENDTD